jgi:hypothetical protein
MLPRRRRAYTTASSDLSGDSRWIDDADLRHKQRAAERGNDRAVTKTKV